MIDRKNNTGYCNTGHRNTGYCNTGNHNTGNYNTGYHNTGNGNTENYNTGDCNTGNYNTGDCNTGNWNTGYRNTGGWNSIHHETGSFNTTKADTIRVFNKTISRSEWDRAYLPHFLHFILTEWVEKSDMTDREKKDHPDYKTTGGYLKSYEYKEAFQNSWDEADPEDRERVWDIPGFDPDIFYEISGIDVREGQIKELTVAEVSKLLGYAVKIIK
jgi:hypothetical protein